jgi:MoaA/NifB/PqqE/SkfB family radical SAM enzyme
VELACRHLQPAVVHVPTNAIAVKRIVRGVEEILQVLQRVSPATLLTVKPSFDGLGEQHDEIRGVRGNFERLLELLEQLAPLRQAFPSLKVGLGTVVSTFNVEQLAGIAEFAERAGVDSYINEIAEVRSEMFNADSGITPEVEAYARAMVGFKARTERMLRQRRGLSRVTLAFRLYYYDLVVRILREQRQVLPCYAGVSNVHISPYGDLWPCCIRAYDGSFGNVREAGYDFFRVWCSGRAAAVRRGIRAGECACPLANQAYSNMLFSPEALLYVLARLLGSGAETGERS